ncbi:HAD family hydrolase [Streptomyces sp. MUM 178J]|uniref:HAD family hydrolase n=1 Tax=Streptomyces sp. MUM 178J TaxID=2791991 RepID=UPI001F042BC2|nr:HAD-IA family hydrolase [Streptomyces sp. MUM 178J]WRQ79875.1 HAD-IA family hydrolase [Streptomyces sp. MUM 178J]
MERSTGAGTHEQATVEPPGPRPVHAAVFDADGVLIDSAGVHAAAWKRAFDACLHALADRDSPQGRPFDEDDEYRRLVDGRSRVEGARSFLTSRGLYLPLGAPDDPPGCDTIWAVAARKDQMFVAALRERPVRVFPEVPEVLHALRRARVACAAASASRHAGELLAAAGIADLLDAVVDGTEVARLRLASKPDPALFLETAHRLAAPPSATALVEDAAVGVQAARRGGFALVVGVNRAGSRAGADRLRASGADTVVEDLTGLPGRIRRGSEL